MCSHSRNWNKPKQKVRFLVAPLLKQSECSAVGSALRSGRRGRAFESPHSDKVKGSFLEYSKLPFIIFRLSGRNRNSRTEIYQPIIS